MIASITRLPDHCGAIHDEGKRNAQATHFPPWSLRAGAIPMRVARQIFFSRRQSIFSLRILKS
ncbi:hypothetical protein [Ensifer adhaerens]|uniref:hypothetical protein n=1 Tax=Ensifer adhaerens TaxID=106592 RepID=UPI001319DE6B|nr:hypothetical protein [Ensifer adhaerens]